MGYRSAFALLLLAVCGPAYGQTPSSSLAPVATERFELQTATISTRYRIIENSADQVTANQVQFKDTLRMRMNFDRDGRYSLSGGLVSGNSFTGSWDNTGIGTGHGAGTQSLRQFFVSAAPVRALEVQAGGLYLLHGENTEITSYDDDGSVMGGRVTVRAPAKAYFDELSVTRAALGPVTTPGALRRLNRLGNPNYWQTQAVKRFGRGVRASSDFTSVDGAETLRAAVAVRFGDAAPLSALRLEAYRRVTRQPASGFALVAERPIVGQARLQGGYADIDPAYGGLNGDRYQDGRRFFAMATIPLIGPLSAQLYGTHAVGSSRVANRTRFDAVVTYDVVAALRSRHQT
jgi:hypothetical protein